MRQSQGIQPSKKNPFKPLSETGPWVIRCAPGLARLAIAEMKFRRIAAADSKALLLKQRNHDLIFMPRAQATSRWDSLRLPEEIHDCLIYGRYKLSNAQIEKLANTLIAQKRPFRLIVTADGPHFSRQDIKRWLSRELQKRHVSVLDNAEAILYIFCIEEAYYICSLRSRFDDLPDRKNRVAERAGSLPPTIAAAMAFMGKPKPADIILDPVCGTGTLLAEAFAVAPDASVIGVDIAEEALKAARRNLSHIQKCELIHGSGTATGLPDAWVTLFLANLPFGKQFGSRETNPELYRALLAEMQRLGVPQLWRAVLLSSDVEAVESALAHFVSLIVTKRVQVNIRGEKGTLFLVTA